MLDDRQIRNLLLRTAAHDEGSADAFEQLYRATAGLLLGVAQRVLGRRELAEEVLHDSFTRIWRGATGFDPMTQQPVAWMTAIARNRALDIQATHAVSRVDSYHEVGVDSENDGPDGVLDKLYDWGGTEPGEAEDQRRLSGWLRKCLGELKPAERQAIVLAYDQGMSHSDLAAHLQKPLGTVKAWIRRGTESLRGCVEACLRGTP